MLNLLRLVLVVLLANSFTCAEVIPAGDAQQIILSKSDSSCLAGRKDAIGDVKRNYFRISEDRYPGELGYYAEEIFLKDFGIEVDIAVEHGLCCIAGEEESDWAKASKRRDECYYAYMDSALIAKFGRNVFLRVESEANALRITHPTRYSGDRMIVYAAGNDSLHKAIKQRVHYPPSAKRDSVQGTVYVRFSVDSSGTVENPVILKGVRRDLDSTALACMTGLTGFIPVLRRGKVSPETLIMPIRFVLK